MGQRILWGFTVGGCDYADLSEVKQNRTFPSLCCLRKHKRVAANNIEYYSCYLQLRAVLRTRLDELTEPASHTAYTCPKGQFCPLWGAAPLSCPSPSAWAWPDTSPRRFQIPNVAKKYSLCSLVLSVHPASSTRSPQGQMSTRPGADEAAGIHTWRGSSTKPFSSCKLLHWLSTAFRLVPLGPSVLLLPMLWLKPQVRSKLKRKRWTIKIKRNQSGSVRTYFCERWDIARTWWEAAIFGALSINQPYVLGRYSECKLIWIESVQIQNTGYNTIQHKHRKHNQCVNWCMSLPAVCHIWADN